MTPLARPEVIDKSPNIKAPLKMCFTKLPYLNKTHNDDDSETETEFEGDSLYDKTNFSGDESRTESMYAPSQHFKTSMDNLSKGIHKATNRYVRKVKMQVDGMMTKMNLPKEEKKHVKKPPPKKSDIFGAGDKSQDKQELLLKLQLQKKKIYDKIEANIKNLKYIDIVIDEIHGINLKVKI